MEGWIIHFPSKVQINSFPFFFKSIKEKKNQALVWCAFKFYMQINGTISSCGHILTHYVCFWSCLCTFISYIYEKNVFNGNVITATSTYTNSVLDRANQVSLDGPGPSYWMHTIKQKWTLKANETVSVVSLWE